LIPTDTGKRQPERKSFYEEIAKTLQGAEQILLFGSGTGRSSAMDTLLADLQKEHADVAKKVVGSVVVDAHHSTEGQLLAKARDFYAEFNRA
jgi:predicted RNA-binding protein with PIN domain